MDGSCKDRSGGVLLIRGFGLGLIGIDNILHAADPNIVGLSLC